MLTFAQFRIANEARCREVFHPVELWNPLEWAGAMCGESGEAANLCKKLKRGEQVATEKIADELADVVAYADLLAASLGIDLGQAVAKKFNEISDRKGSTIKLLPGTAVQSPDH